MVISVAAVSYTHLDVYKRQTFHNRSNRVQIGLFKLRGYDAGNVFRRVGLDIIHAFLKRIGKSLDDFRVLVNITLLCGEGSVWPVSYTHLIEDEEFKIWFKNENHVCWKNGQPYVSSPDLICIVDKDTAEPIPNPKMKGAKEVAILALPCKPQLREEKIKNVLCPKYFGFEDIEYVPVETVMEGK